MIAQLQQATRDSPSRARQAEALAEDAVQACEAQAARDSSADSGLSRRVLVVDDEPAMRNLLAANATDAIARIEQQGYDIVVVDSMLPDFNGLEVIAAIRNGSRATGGIVITGYGDVKTATEALRAHADDYLLKPFKISESLASLERSLGRRACIRGMRITVALIVNLVANGMSTAEILREYPDLEPEDVQEALQYAASLAREETFELTGSRS